MSNLSAETNDLIKKFTGQRTKLEALLTLSERWGIVYEHLLQDERFTTWWRPDGIFTLKMNVDGEDRPVFQMSTLGVLRECENPFLAAHHRFGDDQVRLVMFKKYVDERPWIFNWIRPDMFGELFDSVMRR